MNWIKDIHWKPTPRHRPGGSARLTVRIGLLAANYQRLAGHAKPARVAAVVKADAYGLGAERIAAVLFAHGCRDFFVADCAEALSLRTSLPERSNIYVLNGTLPGQEHSCIQNGIIPVINSVDQWTNWAIAAQAHDAPLPVALQVDSGMGRLGIQPEDIPMIAGWTREESSIRVHLLMSHLACADEPDHPMNQAQHAEMARIAGYFPGAPMSLANSAGAFLGTSFRGDMIRAGIALYGGPVRIDGLAPLDRVIDLEASVIQIRTVPAGTAVGYGAAHVTQRPTRLAVIGIGYADGLPRSLFGKGAVYWEGVRLPLVGRVSMDSILVDISALPAGALSAGHVVEVIGQHQSIADLARDAGTIAHEILTGLGDRLDRIYR